jgi:hypothetical protein
MQCDKYIFFSSFLRNENIEIHVNYKTCKNNNKMQIIFFMRDLFKIHGI